MVDLLRQALGVDIPSTPIFVAAIAIHVPAGLVCVITGLLAATAKKRPGRHPITGTIYYWGLSVIFVTALAMSAVRWPEDAYLVVFATIAFGAATLGRQARRRGWVNWPWFHIPGMGLSYVALITAFYIDNGPHLPLWKLLPHAVYWVFPSVIGVPLIVRSLRSRQAGALTALSRRRARPVTP